MKNPLLVIRLSGTIKQILRILEVLLEMEREAEAGEKARVQRKTAAQEAKAALKAMPKAPFGQIEKAITKAYKDAGIPENDEPFGKETANAPVCETCGTSADMALIKFTDKNTGKPRSAWKCLQCGNWEGALSLFTSPSKGEGA